MPDVGVLNLTIQDNSNVAAGGLNSLRKALEKVQTAVGAGLDMSGISGQIRDLSTAVSNNGKTLAGIGTLLNAVSSYYKTIGKFANVQINTTPIEQIKKAVGDDGIRIGNAGSQINILRTALEGEWKTDNAFQASMSLSAIAEGAKSMSGAGLGSIANNVTKLAGALNLYADASERLNSLSQGGIVGPGGEEMGANLANATAQGVLDNTGDAMSAAKEMALAMIEAAKRVLHIESPSRVFRDEVGANIPKGTALGIVYHQGEVISAVQEMAESAVGAAKQAVSGFDYKQIDMLASLGTAVESLSGTHRDMATNAQLYGMGIGAALPKIQKLSSEEMIIAGNARQATEAINRLINALDHPAKGGMKMKDVAELVSGITMPAAASAEESAKTFSQYTDQIIEVEKALDSAAEAKRAVEDVKTVGLETADLAKIPSSGMNGMFESAAQEAAHLKDQLEQARQELELWDDVYKKTQKRIKYNGATDERTNMLGHAEEGFSLAYEKMEKYKSALAQLEEFVKKHVETMHQVTQATQEHTEAVQGTVQAVASGMQSVEGAVNATGNAIDRTKRAYRYYNSIEDAFNGIRYNGKKLENDLMPKWLQGEGTKNEQMFALKSLAHDFGMTVEEVKKQIDELRAAKAALAERTAAPGADMQGTASGMADITEESQRAVFGFNNFGDSIRSALLSVKDFMFGTEGLHGSLKRMFPTLTGLVKRFQGMAKMRAMRYIVRQIAAGVSEGMKNVYYYSQAVGTSFAPAMDNAATSLLMMKNSIGAMLAPAVQALIPLLQTVVNWFITGINYINQFFALLNGQKTWTKAIEYSTEAYEDNTKAAKQASKAAKDLLADWDELNIIQSNSGGGGSGTNKKDEKNYKEMFEEVGAYNERIKNLVDGIKERFGDVWTLAKRIAGTIFGWKLASTFTNWLGVIGGLVSTALTLDITFNLVNMFASDFLRTGDPGYLIGNLLTTMIGGYFTKKILSKVLAGKFVSLAIPLTLIVSAIANAKAELDATDVSALSKESLITSTLSALELGGAFTYLLYKGAGLTGGMAAGLGGAATLMTFGVLIGLKATKEVMDTGDITVDTLKSDLLSAGAVGGGLFVAGMILKAGTIGTLMGVGGAGAVLTLGALLAIQGIAKMAKDDAAITWGNRTATEDQIREFVEAEMFDADLKLNITAYEESVQLGEGVDTNIETKIAKLLPEMHSLVVGIDTQKSLDNIHSLIFDEGGLIDAYNKKYETSIATVKAAINIVPIKDDKGNDLSAEYFKGVSEGWNQLNGVMQQLGKDLADEMVKANNAEMGSAARRIYENNVGILSQIMIDVNSAIASRRVHSEASQTFREGVENWDWSQQSYNDLLTYYNEQKDDTRRKIESAYQTYYDEIDDLITANTVMLEDAQKYGLTEIGGKTIEEIQNEIDELNVLRKKLDENKRTSIAAAEAFYATGSGYELLHDAILAHLNKMLTKEDVAATAGRAKLGADIIRDYFTNPESASNTDIDTLLHDIVDGYLKASFGEKNFDTLKSMIDAGILNYRDLIDDSFFEALRKRYNISDDYQAEWQQLIDQYFHPEALKELENQQPEVPKVEGPKFENDTFLTDTATELKESNVVQEAADATESFRELGDAAAETTQNVLSLDEVTFETANLETSANTAATAIEDMARRIRDAFATLNGLSYEMDISGEKFSGAMSVLIPNIEGRASGGFIKSGDLIMANENGNIEMMGRMGTQPVVANNQQIVNGISSGVAQANTGVESRLGAIETLLTRLLQKEIVAKAVPGSSWGAHNQRSEAAYDKVTG